MDKIKWLIGFSVVLFLGILFSQVLWIQSTFAITKTQYLQNATNVCNEYFIDLRKKKIDELLEGVMQKRDANIADVGGLVNMKAALNEIEPVSVNIYGSKRDSNEINRTIEDPVNTASSIRIKENAKENLTEMITNDSAKTTIVMKQLEIDIYPALEALKIKLNERGIDTLIDFDVSDKPFSIINGVDTLQDKDNSSWFELKSGWIHTGLNNWKIQMNFKNGKAIIFSQIWVMGVLSVIMVVGAALMLLFLIRTILYQKRLSEMKHEFTNNMTHELKTPVSTVSIAIEAIQKFDVIHDKEKTERYLHIANSELSRLSLMIDKILKTSAFERNEVVYNWEKINLRPVALQVINNFSLQFEKQNVTFKVDMANGDFFVKGDKTHLANVIYNLIDNAIKYSGANPFIKFELKTETRKIKLLVSDNGTGIPAEYQAKVFDKFFRVPSGDVHNVKGYGLGLSYVKSVVEDHGGKVSVISASGEGTTFIIELNSIVE